MGHDDREEFERSRRDDAARMAGSNELRAKAADLFTASDAYNYSYMWNWCGLPIIQLPADVVTLQEVIWTARPSLIIETGVARGGSVIFFASMLQLVGRGKVVGIDVDIRPHNRAAIDQHPFRHRIELIEGSSTDPGVLERVSDLARQHEDVMVVLDSDHTHQHVLAELKLYGDLVSEGQFLVVADTIVEEMPFQTREREWGPGNNPATALQEYLASTDRFQPDDWINNKLLLTNSPGGYLRCVAARR